MREGDHTRGVSLEDGTAQPDGEWLSRSPQPDIPWTDTKPAKSLAAVAATSRQPWAGRSPTQLFLPCSENQDSSEMCAKRNESNSDYQSPLRSGTQGPCGSGAGQKTSASGDARPGADNRRRQHRCETRRSRRQAHRASQQSLMTPTGQLLATLLAQKTDADPTLCIRPKYSVKKPVLALAAFKPS